MTRLEANREIVKIISEIVDKFPDFRFDQILWYLHIEDGSDHFYRESNELLNEIKQIKII